MITTVWGVVREGRIDLPGGVELENGKRVLVTVLPEDEDANFWLAASQSSFDAIWNNPEDDAHAELLKE